MHLVVTTSVATVPRRTVPVPRRSKSAPREKASVPAVPKTSAAASESSGVPEPKRPPKKKARPSSVPEREVQSSAPSVPERRDRVGQIPDFFELAWCCIRFHLWLDAPLLEVFFEYLEEAGTDVLTFVGKFLFSVRSRSPAVTAKKTPVKKPDRKSVV